MKILVVSPVVTYPVSAGNQEYIDGFLKILLKMGYNVSLACLSKNDPTPSKLIESRLREHYRGISQVLVAKHPQKRKKLNFVKVISKVISTCEPKSMISSELTCPWNFVKRIWEIADGFDVIIINYLSMSRCIPPTYRGKKIIFTHDIQSNIIRAAQAIGLRKEINLSRYQRAEVKGLNKFDTIVSINKNESRWFQSVCKTKTVVTLPPLMPLKSKQTHDIAYDLLFIGSSSAFNISGLRKFIQKIFPKIVKKIPNIRFAIAGSVSICASIIKDSSRFPNNIFRLGRVDDLSFVYHKSKIVVSPIYEGAGVKVKNYEALSYGKPLVGTRFSFDGIAVVPDQDAILVDSDEEFVNRLLGLLQSDINQERLSQNALAFMKRLELSFPLLVESILGPTESDIQKENVDDFGRFYDRQKMVCKSDGKLQKRHKALIFTNDAQSIIGFNLELAATLSSLGCFCEFVKSTPYGAGEISSKGYSVWSIHNQLDNEYRKQLLRDKNLFSFNEQGMLEKIVYDGVDISNEFNIYKQMFPEHFSDEKKVRSTVAHCLVCLKALLKIVRKLKPSFLVGWNGNGGSFNFLVKIAAKISKIPCIHLERGLLNKTICISPTEMNFQSLLAGSYLPPVTYLEEEMAKLKIGKFRSQKRSVVNVVNERKNLSKQEILSILNIKTKDYIFFPMQIDTDSNIVINSPKWKRMSGVIKMLSAFSQKSGITVVCRPHPESHSTETPSFEGVVYDRSINLYTIMQHAKACVVINSTVGLESILLGLPTLTLGNSIYSTKGLTFPVSCVDDLEEFFTNYDSNLLLLKQQNKNLIRFVDLLYSNYLIDLEDQEQRRNVVKKVLNSVGINVVDQRPIKLSQSGRSSLNIYNQFCGAVKSADFVVLKCEKLLKESLWFSGSDRPQVTFDLLASIFVSRYGKTPVRSIEQARGANILVLEALPDGEKFAKNEGVWYLDKYLYPLEITKCITFSQN